jgi:glycosyltransferase involved in cell wall biosynthesis
VRRERPDVIWSTYPIATAHLIGLTLHRLTRLPWIADFRDSMTEDGYPEDPRTRAMYQWIERRVVANADRVVFTTPGTRRMYEERYPEIPQGRWTIIPNGYDEENFSTLSLEANRSSQPAGPTTLVHSGVLYPKERDPRAFFDALALLKQQGEISERTLRIVLRASGHDNVIAPMISQRSLESIVLLAPAVPYRDALKEMVLADGLLIFQAANCNHQIPAKVYEYMRAGRPIFAITDRRGDTAETLRSAGITTIGQLDDAADLAAQLRFFLISLAKGEAPVAAKHVASRFSRRAQAKELAGLFAAVVQSRRNRTCVTEK